MGSTPSIGCYYFEEWDLPTKHGWMHSGAGVHAAATTQEAVQRMAERLIASGELVRGLLGGAEWAGAAAVAAGEAMRRGGDQITQSAASAATADRCVSELGECFLTAQRKVPSPNEVPTGLGDRFLYGAAENFNTISPFEVQSPLHTAMRQRSELDHQANMALSEHMTISRERVEAMPTITAPAPMAVTTQSAPPPADIGPATPSTALTGSASMPPAATTPAGVNAGPAVGNVAPGPVAPGPVPPGPVPARTNLTGAGTGPGIDSPANRPSFGPVPPGVGGREDVRGGGGSGTVTGRGGLGAGSGAGGGVTGRGAAGTAGSAPPRVAGAESAATGRGTGAGGAGRPGTNSFLHPPVGGQARGDDDTEHRDRYAQHTDHIVGELPLVAPSVLGETPDEEARRLQGDR